MIYTPKHFSSDKNEQIIDFIEKYSFGTIISCKDNVVKHVTKIPFLLKCHNNEYFMEGHLAKANPHVNFIRNNCKLIIMFDGPHDYISPTWYLDQSRSVPTWNFSTVIADGNAFIYEDKERLKESVIELSRKYEKDSSWENGLDQEYFTNLLNAIEGIEVRIETFHSKFKLSQNQNKENLNNVISKLANHNLELSYLMKNFR